MRKLPTFLFVALLATVALGEAREVVRFHVSPSGDNANPGTVEKPLATVHRAQEAVREVRQSQPEAGLAIILAPGAHFLDRSLKITELDSGIAEGSDFCILGDSEEETRLIGGRRISGFGPVMDRAVLARLPEAARGRVVQTNLKAQGITDYGELTPRGFGKTTKKGHLELFFNRKRMPLAGWPNEGWAALGWAPGKKPEKLPPKGHRPVTKDHFLYEGDRPARWLAAEDLWVHGYWKHDWADGYVKVKAIDPKQRRIDTYAPHGVYGCVPEQRWRALNLLEELDAPGEWWLDRKTGVLYFWPPSAVADGEAMVSMLDEPMILVEGASRVVVAHLAIECSRGSGIEGRGGYLTLVAGCSIRNVGGAGVRVRGGSGHQVILCHIHDVGEAGIQMVAGDRKTLESVLCLASGNHIHHYARWCRTYRPGIGVSGVGVVVDENLIHHAPHVGILLGGNDHTIEGNEIHHVALETGDVGALYMGRDWTARGTVIRHNHFHDIHGLNMGANAVYLDDAASGITVEGNVFRNVNRAAFIGGGRDNRVVNNVFVNCKIAVHVDARGLGWAKEHIAKGGGWRMYEKLAAVKHDRPPYSDRYPDLAKILEGDPRIPLGNALERNIAVGGRWLDTPGVKREWLTIRGNFTEGDPGFVDAAGGNFRLREDAPARKIHFDAIPFDKIGPRETPGAPSPATRPSKAD